MVSRARMPRRQSCLLCEELLPKANQSEEEFDRLAAKLEDLAILILNNPGPKEIEISKLLEKLLQIYDDEHCELPPASPKEHSAFFRSSGACGRSTWRRPRAPEPGIGDPQ